MLKPGGTLAVIDWFKQTELPAARHRAYITPIERGMLVELETITNYAEMIRVAGLDVTHTDDLSERYLYDFQDPKVKTFSEMARVLQRRGFEVKRNVAEAIARIREVRADLYREGGSETREGPAVKALVEHGERLERREADGWLAVFEDLYGRIDRDEGAESVLEQSGRGVALMLAGLALEVDGLQHHIEGVARSVSV